MTWTDALDAINRGDQAQLERYTVEEVHLPRTSAHFVSLALWQSRARLERMTVADNPAAYVRTVAQRLQRDDEELELGKRTVYDQHHRPIGYRTVGTMGRDDGSIIDFPQEWLFDGPGALGFVPAEGVDPAAVIEPPPRAAARAHYNARFIPHDHLTPEQIVLQRAQCQGISRSEMPEHLGWDRRRVERVRKQLDSLRRRGLQGQTAQPVPLLHARGIENFFDDGGDAP